MFSSNYHINLDEPYWIALVTIPTIMAIILTMYSWQWLHYIFIILVLYLQEIPPNLEEKKIGILINGQGFTSNPEEIVEIKTEMSHN